MNPLLLSIGAFSAMIAVTVGGARAHVLDKRLPRERLPMLEVGMRYQMAHSIGILVSSLAVANFPGNLSWLAACGFIFGTVIFCGAMYTYAFTGHKCLMRLTPVGGVVFMSSWAMLALSPLFVAH